MVTQALVAEGKVPPYDLVHTPTGFKYSTRAVSGGPVTHSTAHLPFQPPPGWTPLPVHVPSSSTVSGAVSSSAVSVPSDSVTPSPLAADANDAMVDVAPPAARLVGIELNPGPGTRELRTLIRERIVAYLDSPLIEEDELRQSPTGVWYVTPRRITGASGLPRPLAQCSLASFADIIAGVPIKSRIALVLAMRQTEAYRELEAQILVVLESMIAQGTVVRQRFGNDHVYLLASSWTFRASASSSTVVRGHLERADPESVSAPVATPPAGRLVGIELNSGTTGDGHDDTSTNYADCRAPSPFSPLHPDNAKQQVASFVEI